MRANATSVAPAATGEAMPPARRPGWQSVPVPVVLGFAVTVFSTVGFGDITAKTEAARLVVTGQMIADLVILGLAVKIILGAVSRRRQPGDADGAQPAQQIRR
jgi:Ion channel